MKKLTIALPLLLAACGAETEAPTVVNDVVAEQETARPDIELAGSYTITAFRNTTIGKPVTATFGEGTMTVSTDCATMVWGMEIDGNLVSFTPQSGQSAGCAGRSTAVENNIAKMVDQTTIAMEMNGGIQFSGSGGALELSPQ